MMSPIYKIMINHSFYIKSDLYKQEQMVPGTLTNKQISQINLINLFYR